MKSVRNHSTNIITITAPSGATGATGADGVDGADGALTAWSRTGNAGTVSGTEFLGTTDNQPLLIKINAVSVIRITATGQIEILGGNGAIFIGENAGNASAIATCVCIGKDCGMVLATGSYESTGVGQDVFKAHTVYCQSNTAMGYQSQMDCANAQAFECSSFGANSLQSDCGARNNCFGAQSGMYLTSVAEACCAFGNETLGRMSVPNSPGKFNNCFGNMTLTYNYTGNSNNAFGYECMKFNSTGSNSCAFGEGSLKNATGANNVSAYGSGSASAITTGGSGIFIGVDSGSATNPTGTANICIGHVGVNTDTQIIRIGTAQTKNFQAGIRGKTADATDSLPVYISSTGQLVTTGNNKGSGSIYTGGGTTVISATTWTLCANLTTPAIVSNFTHVSNTFLTYSGNVTNNFLVTASVTIASSVANTITIGIAKNSATFSRFAQQSVAVAIGIATNFDVSGLFSLATNDTLSIMVYGTSGATITFSYATLNALSQ